MTLTDLIPGGITGKLIGYGMVIAGLFGAGYYTAHRFDRATIQTMKTEAAKQEAARALQANATLAKGMQDAYGQAVKDNAANTVSAVAQQKIVTVYRTIHDEVSHAQIPTTCSHLGDDWVRAYNAAVIAVHPGTTEGAP